MFTVENRIGRLVEIRLSLPMTVEEMLSFGAACKRELGKALRRQPGKLAVVVSDLRGLTLFSPELFVAMIGVMRENNVMCERAAQMAERSAIGAMQADRAVREAGLATRRNFSDAPQLVAFLKEVLTEGEAARAATFLAEYKPVVKR